MVFNENLNDRASWTEGRQTEGRTDGQIPPVFYRALSPSGPLPKKELGKQRVKGRKENKKGKKGR